tara:strand:+ start:5969 stop:7303 length:1335 start_codon:yes stop_codon:yes gene_type:complete
MNEYNNIPEYFVSQFNKKFKTLIESEFDYVKIRGEISEIKTATKGQIYLTIKDEESILSGVIWASKKKFLNYLPELGMDVILIGRITTWSKFKTTYQIDIDNIEIAGEGALLKLIEERKKRLEKKGLFDKKYKKNIPFLPEKVGVITSPTGSVIYDIINRIKERFPTDIELWPVSVQGNESANEIIFAIEGFNNVDYKDKPEVIIIARGGGSVEDLMTFNDERLVLAIFKSSIPIISAIGHETDTTLVDYVSDLRASTPTAAAEKVVPVRTELIDSIKFKFEKISIKFDNILEKNKSKTKNLSKLLKSPDVIINSYKLKLSNLFDLFKKDFNSLVEMKLSDLSKFVKQLRLPKEKIKYNKIDLSNLIKNIDKSLKEIQYKKYNEFRNYSRLLETNSISSNLKKGYSILSKSKKIIKNSTQIKTNDLIEAKFLENTAKIKIKKIN